MADDTIYKTDRHRSFITGYHIKQSKQIEQSKHCRAQTDGKYISFDIGTLLAVSENIMAYSRI